jgi:hypothetical protein
MQTIDRLINSFKNLWYYKTDNNNNNNISNNKVMENIEGYVLMQDTKSNKTLLMIKDSEKSWKTQWFNDNEVNYKFMNEPLSNVFINKK